MGKSVLFGLSKSLSDACDFERRYFKMKFSLSHLAFEQFFPSTTTLKSMLCGSTHLYLI
jgi:hypothetical protein